MQERSYIIIMTERQVSYKHFDRPPTAANNFLAGAGQIVRSNLFLLGHIPFLAGQTSMMIILNLSLFKT